MVAVFARSQDMNFLATRRRGRGVMGGRQLSARLAPDGGKRNVAGASRLWRQLDVTIDKRVEVDCAHSRPVLSSRYLLRALHHTRRL